MPYDVCVPLLKSTFHFPALVFHNWRGLTADAADLTLGEKKTPNFGRIQAMSLPGGFSLDDSASNELVGVKFYDLVFDQTTSKSADLSACDRGLAQGEVEVK